MCSDFLSHNKEIKNYFVNFQIQKISDVLRHFQNQKRCLSERFSDFQPFRTTRVGSQLDVLVQLYFPNLSELHSYLHRYTFYHL